MILSMKKKILAVFSFLNSEHESSQTFSDHGRLLLALHLDHLPQAEDRGGIGLRDAPADRKRGEDHED